MLLIQSVLFKFLFRFFPSIRVISETSSSQVPVSIWKYIFHFRNMRNKSLHWPINFTSQVSCAHNIYCGIETSPGYMQGCYIQGYGGVYIGDYTQIGPFVAIISSNHMPYDTRKHSMKPVVIGKYCWIGYGAIILPGVRLGDFTTVAAGAVVTKSYPAGYLIIGGNPAKALKVLDTDLCLPFRSKYEYNGFTKSSLFNHMTTDEFLFFLGKS